VSLATQLFVIGLAQGAVYALVAQGMVVIYRGSGVLNFAQGALTFLAADFFANVAIHVGTLLAAVLAVCLAGAIGAGAQLMVMRPLRHASPLVRVISTLGILTVLEQGALIIWGPDTQFTDGILPLAPVRLAKGVSVSQQDLWLVGIAIGVTLLLLVVYRRTQFGRLTVAVAQDDLAAAVVGWSPQLIATLNWTIGGLLAGLAGVLIEPVTGTDGNTLTLLIEPAVVVALLAQFRSFPITLVCALVIGGAQAVLQNYTSSGLTQSAPFIILMAVLVIRGRSLPLRGHLLEKLPRISEARRYPRTVLALTVAAVVLVLLNSADLASAVTATGVTAIVALSLVVVTGYAGQISLAQLAFAGLGAFFAGRTADAWGVPFLVAICLAVLATVPIGIVFGIPALRTRGAMLAVVTLGLALVINELILGSPSLTGGPVRGTVVGPATIFGLPVDAVNHPQRYAAVVVLAFTILGLGVINLRCGTAGRRLMAIRANERAAASLGVSVFAGKLYAFAVAAGIAAVGGALAAFEASQVTFSQYDVLSSINVVVYAVTGGIGSVAGAGLAGTLAPGAIPAWIVGHWLNVTAWVLFVAGVLAVITLVVQPDGIALKNQEISAAIRRRLPRKAGRKLLSAGGAVRVRSARLDVQGVKKRFGGVVALDDVSVAVAPGEVVGLIGPNGAGKTVLIDLIVGESAPDAGTVRVDGERVDGWSVRKRARRGIGRSFQSLELFEDMTVGENLRCACDDGGYVTYVRDLILPRQAELTAAALAAVEEFGLADELERRPSELSHGRRHLVAIARVVAMAPSILLLDEPCAGLDDHERRHMGDLIGRLAREWGMGVLLIEHDAELVMGVCDRVVALDFGRVIASGTSAEVRQSEAVINAYLGREEETVEGVVQR
jgi:ABC-type branched-subunit amino acid transport system ATPase component/ABC-type branched-subunit amino acid transport system permease subunit